VEAPSTKVHIHVEEQGGGAPFVEDQGKQVVEDSLRGSAVAKIAWPRCTSQEDISAAASAMTVQALVIAGELDQVDSVSTLEAELLARIPHAVMYVLRGTGYVSSRESPRDIAQLLGQFLNRWRRKRRRLTAGKPAAYAAVCTTHVPPTSQAFRQSSS
jgi:hypothetical protein